MTELFPSDDPQLPSFDDLVGEGKKYKTPEDAAKAIVEKDRFIEQLKQEAAEARAELKARLNLEELADKVVRERTSSQPNADQPNNPIRRDPALEEGNKAPADIKEEVRRLLEEEKARESRKSNLDKSIDGLKELYGADYQQALIKAAQDLGVSKEYLTDMASTTPRGFLNLISSVIPKDDNRPTTPPETNEGRVSTATNGKRNAAYYSELRRTDPKKYFSKQTQQDMFKDMKTLGDAFFS